ncbi:hypothetical protein FB45DRAFT_872341 [Roridomyces roridus]|uniref:Uncharacterized protein n=1 Tax=Roridomyces roridus TaxID=1738132 RepID=A0AAD7FFV8_9AGAR|nr:hypothetical protein FB45DRAFT_872341 [Roridomyces roridus]
MEAITVATFVLIIFLALALLLGLASFLRSYHNTPPRTDRERERGRDLDLQRNIILLFDSQVTLGEAGLLCPPPPPYFPRPPSYLEKDPGEEEEEGRRRSIADAHVLTDDPGPVGTRVDAESESVSDVQTVDLGLWRPIELTRLPDCMFSHEYQYLISPTASPNGYRWGTTRIGTTCRRRSARCYLGVGSQSMMLGQKTSGVAQRRAVLGLIFKGSYKSPHCRTFAATATAVHRAVPPTSAGPQGGGLVISSSHEWDQKGACELFSEVKNWSKDSCLEAGLGMCNSDFFIEAHFSTSTFSPRRPNPGLIPKFPV